MSDFKILAEQAITSAELKEQLTNIRKRDGELNYRSEKTEEYLNHVVKLSPSAALELTKKLKDLQLLRLKDEELVKIVDFLPRNEDEIKLILSSSNITLKKEDAKKITDLIESAS